MRPIWLRRQAAVATATAAAATADVDRAKASGSDISNRISAGAALPLIAAAAATYCQVAKFFRFVSEKPEVVHWVTIHCC